MSAQKQPLAGEIAIVTGASSGSGVSVSAVSPGFIRTAMNDERAGLPGPELIARTTAKLVQHPRREVIRPRFFYIPLFYHLAAWIERLFPWVVDFAARPRRSGDDHRG